MSDSFYSYFGQLRGGTISTSLIFSNLSEIKAVDDGRLIAIISEHDDDSSFFPSALGNAVIIAHQDNLLTVYGNIDKETLPDSICNANTIHTGTVFGTSGNSGWQQGHSNLEFQVIDTKNNTAINPRVLMPRIGTELPLTLGNISLESKNNTRYDLSVQRTIPTGLYRVYRQRQSIAIPYRTRISVNGISVDEISYDLLIQDSNELCVTGKKNYPIEVLYPDNNRQLLGEVSLTQGRNMLGITLVDILGKETTAAWTLNIY